MAAASSATVGTGSQPVAETSTPQVSATAGMATSLKKQQQQAKTGPVDTHTCWIVIGPAGTGKSTVAEYLAAALDAPFVEGDSFHPQANIAKMSAGIPLTDEDRWEWLATLRDECVRRLSASGAGADVVLTCSALKRSYRDVMRAAALVTAATATTVVTPSSESAVPVNIRVRFVYLHAPEEVVTSRAMARQGHYMAADMVRSQFSILEPPGDDERDDVVWIDATGTLEEVEHEVLVKATAVKQLGGE
jgi:gluconokinase